jgi:hypothetical protein
MTGEYSGPDRRVLDPALPAAPATETTDAGKRYYVRTGDVLLNVDGPHAQRTTVMLHNLHHGHRTTGLSVRQSDGRTAVMDALADGDRRGGGR